MGQIATISVYDDGANTNARIFQPVFADGITAAWDLPDVALTVAGRPQVLSKIAVNGNPDLSRGTVNFSYPVRTTVDGNEVVDGIARMKVEFIIPKNMTAADRTVFGNLGSRLMTTSTFRSLLNDGERIY